MDDGIKRHVGKYKLEVGEKAVNAVKNCFRKLHAVPCDHFSNGFASCSGEGETKSESEHG